MVSVSRGVTRVRGLQGWPGNLFSALPDPDDREDIALKMGEQQQPDLVRVWDHVAETYDASVVSSASYQANFNVMHEIMGDPKGRSFCEVGCGSGATSAMFAQLGARAVLLDISPKSLEFARNYFAERNLQADFHLQNALHMTIPDNSFDVVWNAGVIEHFQDDGKVMLIREMWRILAPGGLLLIQLPYAWDIPFRVGKLILRCRGTWAYGFEDNLSRRRIAGLARRAGLTDFHSLVFNPVAGWWFLPKGKWLTERLGLNTLKRHSKKTRMGHNLIFYARKPKGPPS